MTAPLDFTIAPPGFRLPAELELGSVHLQVADLQRSADYYQRVLGLTAHGTGSSRMRLTPAGSALSLIELHEHPGAAPVPRRGRLGLYHFALLLPDRASLGRFLAHLGGLGEHAGMSDHLVSEALYLTDPDGLGIEVYADRPRAAWRVDGNRLAMAVDPLDVDDVLRAGHGGEWRGMPEGTRVGHVHLHVGDLEQAGAFYHAGLGLDRVAMRLPGALFLSAGGYHHHLGTNTWAAGAPPAGAQDARLLEWTIRLPERLQVTAAVRSLERGGHAVGWDGSDAVATDPWDTPVRLVAAGDGH
jgi:catechol 2,3-dioxygenase